MRKLKDILRLHHASGLSRRAIAAALNIGYGTVVNYLNRANKVHLSWPLPEGLDDNALCELLFRRAPTGPQRFIAPDCAAIHQELKRKGVTKQLLWEEYKQIHGQRGYQYSQYCHHYRQWCTKQKRSMRQDHRAGEKLFVDYCGPTVPIVNPDTGEFKQAQIFVAVLGASNYTFACASWSQKQPDWINAHIMAFNYFGGVTEIIVPDNLRSAVRKAHRYTPDLNPAYQQMASYYQTAIVPARPYKPKDKAKAEVAVQIVERWIMARLRHHTFFTLAALNKAMGELLTDLNQRPFKKLPGCRLTQFERIDKPALKPLPAHAYEYVDIKQARVHIDYHIEYDKHYYSVPHHLVKQQVEVHASRHLISVYAHGLRVASHPRRFQPGAHSTCTEHMPQAHQAYRVMSDWSPERFLRWAGDIGPQTRQVVDQILQQKRHKEQTYRQVLALLSSAKRYGRDRLNNACARALDINSPTRRSVKSILEKGIDRIKNESTTTQTQEDLFVDDHENIRGENYYH